jgi:hypothetical protein
MHDPVAVEIAEGVHQLCDVVSRQVLTQHIRL